MQSTKGYGILIESSRKVGISRDVIFNKKEEVHIHLIENSTTSSQTENQGDFPEILDTEQLKDTIQEPHENLQEPQQGNWCCIIDCLTVGQNGNINQLMSFVEAENYEYKMEWIKFMDSEIYSLF